MGIEGGGRSESFGRKYSGEDPFERGVEVRGDQVPEDTPEKENYWLAVEMGVTSEKLAELRRYPALEGSSTEHIVLMLLLGKLVEEGPEWDSQRRARVRNLVGVLRAAAYLNMTDREQESLQRLSQANSFNMAALQYEVTPGVVADIRWIWSTFGLKRPTQGFGASILATQSRRPQLRPRN